MKKEYVSLTTGEIVDGVSGIIKAVLSYRKFDIGLMFSSMFAWERF